ncbi:MAG: UDP-N-acetylmuramoyl-L-alanyl-D-glutamate--2,6-diaminopimelate ligase [Verrucomicrobiota bacterium]
MQLDMLVSQLNTRTVSGSTDVEVTALSYDSRRIDEGSVFFALRGDEVDGHGFVPAAIEAGARAVVAEEEAPSGDNGDVTWVQVEDSRTALADGAKAFWGDPSADVAVAGITGTNGKTTTAFLLQHLLRATWGRCGLLGTVYYDTGLERRVAERTTAEASDNQKMLSEMRDAGCRGAVMEVSSHGLVQERVRGIEFKAGLFTNLSQDHLDYHGDMESYFQAKRLLFEQMASQPSVQSTATMAVNHDDAYGRRLLREFEGTLEAVSFGMGLGADFRAIDPRSDVNGTTFKLEAKGRSFLVRLPHVGRHNVFNALAALAGGSAMGINLRESVSHLGEAPQVPGRLESVVDRKPYKIFVDYAHTPDALENVLGTLRDLSPRRIITVFGCGGDRDRAKRPLMGQAVERLSDVAVVTSDNPRTEVPSRIIEDTLKGMSLGTAVVIEDRREAIEEAIGLAGPRDIVLLAGKGHEAYQEVGRERHPFDDVKIARAVAER